jgi:hypothetical protein
MRERFAMNHAAANPSIDSKSFAPKILPANLYFVRIWRDRRGSKTSNPNQSNGLAGEYRKKIGGGPAEIGDLRCRNLPLRQEGLLLGGDVCILLGFAPDVEDGDRPEGDEIDARDEFGEE